MPELDSVHVYQLKVWIQKISPMVWRRLLVRSDSTIADLHSIIQIAVGWDDVHLNRFHIRGKDFGVYHDGGTGFADNPEQVLLFSFSFRTRERFLYEYDFGDAWLHEVRIEKRLPLDPKRTYPICIDGKHAAPPEDCGGALAYMQIRKSHFEVIVGKSIPEEGVSKCFGLVQSYDDKPKRRLFEVLKRQGMQLNQQIVFLSDGGETCSSILTRKPNTCWIGYMSRCV